MVRTFRLAFALITLGIERCTSETILAFQSGTIPKLVARASITVISIEERELGRARLAKPRIDVVYLIVGAQGASSSLEIKELGMRALDAGLIIPEESLILKTVAHLSSGIELSTRAADNAALVLLTVRVSLLTLVAHTTIFELLFLGAIASICLAVELLTASTLYLFALFRCRVEGGSLSALLALATSCVEVVRCVAGDALSPVEMGSLLGTYASSSSRVCDRAIEAVAVASRCIKPARRQAGRDGGGRCRIFG